MKKLPVWTIIALTIMAIAISYFNFDDISWENNTKSYIGFLAFIILLITGVIIRRKKSLK